MFGTTKLATAVIATVLGLAVTGAAALAAVPPAATTFGIAAADMTGAASIQADRNGTGLGAILDKLVANGTITRAQADAILAALKEAKPRVFGNMLRLAVEYIGLPHQAVAGQLKAGKSLGEIAATQPGKSREGLIAYLTEKITAQLDKAVADGKITQERADEAKSHLTEKVTRFVDHKYERRPAPAKERKDKQRGEKSG